MEMRISFPLLVLCTLLFVHCQSSDQQSTNFDAKRPSSSTLDADSIRRVYQQKLAKYSDPLPTKQIIEHNKVYPVDEAPLDTSFFLYREDLLDAIAKRDVFSLLDACDQNIKVSFGGEDTLPEFIEMWQLDKNAGNSELWPILEKVLRSGGTFAQNRQQFYAPYTYSTFPGEVEGFTHGIITGEGVRFRAQPTTTSRVITNLSYDVVEILPVEEEILEMIGGEEYPWVKIKTSNGKEGWIYGKYFATPIDFRAGFERQPDGGWQMILLVAGD